MHFDAYGGSIMLEAIFLAISAAVFVTAIALALAPTKIKDKVKPFYIIFAGVFASSFLAFLPLYVPVFSGDWSSFITVFFSSIHNTIRLYIVDCDMSFIIEQTEYLAPVVRNVYRAYFNILMVLAPFLTISVVLSFVANFFASISYRLKFGRDAYVFSELNEESLALAQSVKRNYPDSVVVFTNMKDAEDTLPTEMLDKVKKLKAILFKPDVKNVNFRFHSRRKKLYFFIMGTDAAKDVDRVVALSAPYDRKLLKKRTDTPVGYDYPADDIRIYLFSTSFTSEQRLSAIDTKYVKVRRVNAVQSMIYNLLSVKGMDVFDSAQPTGASVKNLATGGTDEEKRISALVVGMGLYGTEMIKALSWFGQMYPYRLEINAFDKDEEASELLRSQIPELYDHNPLTDGDAREDEDGKLYHNGDYTTPGESHYKISVYSGMNADSASFDDAISALTDTTYVFIAVGDDEENIKIATKVRILLRRRGINPVIHTVIYSPRLSEAVKNGRTASGQSYNVTPFGDIPTTYSTECILFSELEKRALERHMKYTNHVIKSNNIVGEERERQLKEAEEQFWKYDYNYRSSIASALHTEFKIKCGSPGSGKTPSERTEEEKVFYRYLEHLRWNAYVRSEGYVYTPKRDKLAKTHHLLVPFDALPYEEQIKDDD